MPVSPKKVPDTFGPLRFVPRSLRSRFTESIIARHDPFKGALSGQKTSGLFLNAAEGRENILHVLSRDPIKQEEGGVEFGLQLGTLARVPFIDERPESSRLREWLHIVAGARQLENSLADPLLQRSLFLPGTGAFVTIGR